MNTFDDIAKLKVNPQNKIKKLIGVVFPRKYVLLLMKH